MNRKNHLGFRIHSMTFRLIATVVLAFFLSSTLPTHLWAANDSSQTALFLTAYSNSLSSSELKKVGGALYRSLKDSAPYQFLDPKELGGRLHSATSPEAFLSQMDETIGQARIQYFEFKFDKAAGMLQNVIELSRAFDIHSPLQKKLSEAYLSLALVFDAQVRPKDAWAAIVNAAALDPAKELDPAQFHPNVIAQFSKAKLEIPQMREGVLNLESVSAGTRVFLNGKELESSPAVFRNLPLGIHTVKLKKDGFSNLERRVMVVLESERYKATPLTIDLDRKEKSLSPKEWADSLLNQASYEVQISKMVQIGNRMRVDQVFSARIEKDKNWVELYVVQVDVQKGKDVARGFVRALNITDLERLITPTVSDLLAQKTPAEWTDLIAVGQSEVDFKTEKSSKKPFYKKWPFYVILGVVVAGAGAGAAFGFKGGGGGGGGAPSSGPVTVTSPAP